MKGCRPLSDVEIKNIVNTFSGIYSIRNKCLFILGLCLGTRISELLSLNISDVYKFGKPVDTIEIKRRYTKGKKQGRQIPLNDQGKEFVSELIQWKAKQGEDISPNAPLFSSRKHVRLSRVQAFRMLQEVYQANELSGRLGTHSLRKTFATTLMNLGSNLRVIQSLLGHSSLSITEKYLGLNFDQLKCAVNNLSFTF